MVRVCRHSTCNCQIDIEADFCGLECEAADAKAPPSVEDETDTACLCGHVNCYRQSDSALISGLEQAP